MLEQKQFLGVYVSHCAQTVQDMASMAMTSWSLTCITHKQQGRTQVGQGRQSDACPHQAAFPDPDTQPCYHSKCKHPAWQQAAQDVSGAQHQHTLAVFT